MKLVAITGAGISKASGIPTFEDMGDLRDKLTREYFEDNPKEFYDMLLIMKEKTDKAQPNNAHVELSNYNIPIITMNIDGLHNKAGSKGVLEVHGNLQYVYCKSCRDKHDYDYIRKSILCPQCGKILEPNVVLYGDSIRYYFNAIDLVGSSEHLLVVGTSFYTSTVNDFVYRARCSGVKITVINQAAETEVAKFLKKIM